MVDFTSVPSGSALIMYNDAPAPMPLWDNRNDYYTNKRGWYLDLPSSGERVVADVAIRGGRAVFSSIIPATGRREKSGF